MPAPLERDANGVPRSTEYGDVYHPIGGALAQARQVFIGGNGLPERWRGRERFVVLETGFGLGNNFLATWQAWRDDPERCERLEFVSIERTRCRAPTCVPNAEVAWQRSPIASSRPGRHSRTTCIGSSSSRPASAPAPVRR